MLNRKSALHGQGYNSCLDFVPVFRNHRHFALNQYLKEIQKKMNFLFNFLLTKVIETNCGESCPLFLLLYLKLNVKNSEVKDFT